MSNSAQVQADDIGCSLSTNTVTRVIEGYHICQAQFAHVEVILPVTNHLLLFHVLSHSSQEDLSHDEVSQEDWLPSLFICGLKPVMPDNKKTSEALGIRF